MVTPQNDWNEHRLLVLALLERHEQSIKDCEDNYHVLRDELKGEVRETRTAIVARVDEQFNNLAQMHRDLVERGIREIKEEMEREREEAVEVKVAEITRSKAFWVQVLISITAVAVALVALLS